MTFVPGVPVNVSFQINSSLNGTQIYELIDNRNDPTGYLSFRVASTSTSIDNTFPTIELKLNAEEGFVVDQDGMRLSLQESVGLLLSNGTVSVGVNDGGYVVSNPSAFRAALGIQETFGEYLAAIAATTSDPGIENSPWNDNGTFKFSTGAFSTYFRPDGFSQIFRPDGVSLYLRP